MADFTPTSESIVVLQKAGKDYGVAVIPEGIIGYIPELRALISEMNQVGRLFL
jgi:hypothetical protein